MTSYGPPVYIDDEDDIINHFSKIIDFKKIKPVKFGDPQIKEKLKFTNWHDFYNFEDAKEGHFEADYGLAYILYKFSKHWGVIPAFLTLRNEVLSGKFYDKLYDKLDIPPESLDFNHALGNRWKTVSLQTCE